MTVNKAIIIGYTGRDPECKVGVNGAIASFTIATNDSYKDRNTNEIVKSTDWHKVVVFGKNAEFVEKYLKKGMKIYIEGKIKTGKYTDKNGIERYSTSIQALVIQLLDRKEVGLDLPGADVTAREYFRESSASQQKKTPSSVIFGDSFDDEIPF